MRQGIKAPSQQPRNKRNTDERKHLRQKNEGRKTLFMNYTEKGINKSRLTYLLKGLQIIKQKRRNYLRNGHEWAETH